MSAHPQTELPFPSLDFSGRGAVTLGEIARKLSFTVEHLSHLVDEGTLVALDGKSKEVSRRALRIPLEEYRQFVLKRLTGPGRTKFIAGLPAATLRELRKEIEAALQQAA